MMILRVRQKNLVNWLHMYRRRFWVLRVDDEHLFFSCRRFAFHLPRWWLRTPTKWLLNSVLTRNLYWKENVCKCQNILCIPHSSLCSINLFYCLFACTNFFVHSWLSIPFCIFLLPGSWVLTWEFFLQKKFSQFHLFLVYLNPWVWTFLNAHENEIFWCSGEGILLTVRSAKRNNQLVQAAVNKLVKKNDCN